MDELSRGVYDFTKRVMQVLLENNVMPDAVQVGNEISRGMLWDQGKLPKQWVCLGSWYNLQRLIESGIEASAGSRDGLLL